MANETPTRDTPTDGRDAHTLAAHAAALAAFADVAATVARGPAVMVSSAGTAPVAFNAAADARDRDALAKWLPLLEDCAPLEISDLHDSGANARARKFAALAPSLRFCLVLPLHGPDGERAGTLCAAQRRAHRLTPAQRAGLVALATLAPAAPGARSDSVNSMSELLATMIDSETSRRLRLSGELHDRSLQWLAAARGALTQAMDGASDAGQDERLALCRTLMDDTIDQLRKLQFELYPPLLSDFGLGEALRWLGDRVHEAHGMECEVVVTSALPELEPTLAGFLYFAVRELWVRSATRRSARRSVVNLTCRDGALELLLRDDGRDTGASGGSGVPLRSLEQYLRHGGGELRVRSAKSGGQVIALGVPLATASTASAPATVAEDATPTRRA